MPLSCGGRATDVITSTRAPSRPDRHRLRLGQLVPRRPLRAPRRRARRARHVRRHLPERRLHPDQDVRATPPTSPARSPGTRPRSGSTRRWTRCAGRHPRPRLRPHRPDLGRRRATTAAHRSPNITLYDGHARFTGRTQMLDRRAPVDDHRRPHRARRGRPADASPTRSRGVGVPFHTSDTVMRIDELPERLVILGRGLHRGRVRARVLRVRRRGVDDRPQLAAAARPGRDGRRRLHRAGPRPLGRAPRRQPVATAAATASEVALDAGRRHRRARRPAAAWPRAGVPNGDLLDLPRRRASRRTPEAGSSSTSTSAPRSTASSRSATSARRSSSSTSPTTRRGSSRTTCCTPTRRGAADHRFVPAAVFTEPQIAAVGRTEQQCRADGPRLRRCRSQDYGDVAYGWAMEDDTGFCKVLADRGTGLLLGAHIIGPEASTVIQPLIQAMSFGLTRPRDGHAASTGSTRRCPKWWRTPCSASASDRPALTGAPGDAGSLRGHPGPRARSSRVEHATDPAALPCIPL